jgi:hypothetical protein
VNREKKVLKIKKMEKSLLFANPKQAGKLAKKIIKEKEKLIER